MTYVCIIHAKPIQALRVTVRNAAGNFKLATIFYSQSSRPDGKSNGTPEMFSFVRSNIHHWFFYVFNTVKIRMNTFLWGVWRLSVCFHVGWKLISLKKFSHSKAKNSINNIHWMESGRGKSLERMGKKCQNCCMWETNDGNWLACFGIICRKIEEHHDGTNIKRGKKISFASQSRFNHFQSEKIRVPNNEISTMRIMIQELLLLLFLVVFETHIHRQAQKNSSTPLNAFTVSWMTLFHRECACVLRF